MRFKTKPMAQQLTGFNLLAGKEYFALLMEQGTGKTKVIIDDAARCWGEGEIDALLVFAPNGVHSNWIVNEIPKHMPEWCPTIAAYFSSGKLTKKKEAAIEKLFSIPEKGAINPLRILTISFDSINTKDGIAIVNRFTNTFNAMGVIDESQRIKNPKAIRTENIMKFRRRFPRRRILSGTPITRAPFDAFSQFYFLDPSILRTESYTAFKTEYSEMLPDDHYLVKKLQAGAWAKKDGTPTKRVPQIIERDEQGLPKYRNLEKLQRLISKHSYRVLKKDCLDLPDKIYKSLTFEMTSRQQDIYDRMEKERRTELMALIDTIWKDGKRAGLSEKEAMLVGRELIVANKLSAMAKLQQITCGYLKLEDKSVVRMFKKVMDNPRNYTMMEDVEDVEGSIIFWAPHQDKVAQIIECLREGYESSKIVRYDGLTKKNERMQAIEDFQSGKARFFVGNPQSGGTGITLTKSENTYYYSNSFNLEHRLQSEDRNHRIGTMGQVIYTDLEALDTVDSKIVLSNQQKKNIADIITGDANL